MRVIKELRESCGLSRNKLADLMNVSDSKIYDMETGRRKAKDEDLEVLGKVIAERIDLSYVAGLFDRSSIITITRTAPYKIHKHQHSPAYIARVVFNSKYKILCEIIKNVFGVGKVSTYKNGGMYSYYAHCEDVDNVLQKLLPYIKLKRHKVETLIEFRSFLEKTRDEYRASSWQDIVQQDKNAKEWWTLRKTSQMLRGSIRTNNLANSKVLSNLISRKEFDSKKGIDTWRIAPIINTEEVVNKINQGKQPLDNSIIQKYEEFYNRIRND